MLKYVAPMLAYLTLITASILLFADASRPILPCDCVGNQQNDVKRAEKVARPTDQSGWSAWTDRPIDFFTFWIMVLTAVLAASTIFMWWETKKSADAAKKAAETLPLIERAYVFAKVRLEDDEIWVIHNAQTDHASGHALVVNRGRTPAILKAVVAVSEVRPVNSPPTALPDVGEVPDGITIRADGEHSLGRITASLLPGERVDILEGRRTLYCAGKIEYEDVLGASHDTGFCWHYDRQIGRFRITPHTKLNYRT